MISKLFHGTLSAWVCLIQFLPFHITAVAGPLKLIGSQVIPHQQSEVMRYRRDPSPELGVRVQWMLQNLSENPVELSSETSILLRNATLEHWLDQGQLAWHDTPGAWPDKTIRLDPHSATVWEWNSIGDDWGIGTEVPVMIRDANSTLASFNFQISDPEIYLRSVTFLGSSETSPYPDRLIFHVANQSHESIQLLSCRLWIPDQPGEWQTFSPGSWRCLNQTFPASGQVASNDQGGAILAFDNLPLGYAIVEIKYQQGLLPAQSIMTRIRIKKETFDIGGGWLVSSLKDGNTLQKEPYLKTLKWMYINSGMHQSVSGYTDHPELFEKYPLKYMNRLQPTDQYDQDAVLPRIHAVEFLGEPQYGGGTPVRPMDVWKAFAPYQSTRLPTSVTHSEERIWRYYSGLSDFPHYDAYRVCAPSPDAWTRYDRWGGERIRWGAPLETIGDMTRSLRDLNRPMPIAYWSQGAHDGWGRYGGRNRTSPNPDELRLQAYHGISSRITSLYWFNLSLKSILKFPDLIQPIREIGREIRMMEPWLLSGSAYDFQRQTKATGGPDWDLASVTGPDGALLFALDLNYTADHEIKEFVFGEPRTVDFTFKLPKYLLSAQDVFRFSAAGITSVEWSNVPQGIQIKDTLSRVGVYLVTQNPEARVQLENHRQKLISAEAELQWDPVNNPIHMEELKSLLD